MKFKDMQIGRKFRWGDENYMKIPAIEDKWGNVTIAVSDKGHLLLDDFGIVNIHEIDFHMVGTDPRSAYEECLEKVVSAGDHLAEMEQLFVNMLDRTEQDDREEVYMALHGIVVSMRRLIDARVAAGGI